MVKLNNPTLNSCEIPVILQFAVHEGFVWCLMGEALGKIFKMEICQAHAVHEGLSENQ